MIENILGKFGLSEKETSIYLMLLRYGIQPISVLAKRSSLSRGTVLFVVEKLINKGLASKMEKDKAQHYSAVDPKHLELLLEKRREDLEDMESDLRLAMPVFKSLQKIPSPLPKIRFFEGREGLRTLLDETLLCKSKKIFGILSMEDLYMLFDEDYFEAYVQRRIKTGVELQVLRSRAKDVKDMWHSSKAELRKSRYLPDKTAFRTTTYIYDDKVAFISSERERFGLIIQSEEIHQLQLGMFMAMWEGAGE